MTKYYSELEIRVHIAIWIVLILMVILCFIFPVLVRYFAFLIAFVGLFLFMSTVDLFDRISAYRERIRTSKSVVDENGHIWEEFKLNGCTYRAVKNKEDYYKLMGIR